MKKSLFLKIFFTQVAVTILVLLVVIPAVFMLVGEFFISNNRELVMQDADRVATLVSQVADYEEDERDWAFLKKGIDYIGGHSIVLVADKDGNVIAAPENMTEIDKSKIDGEFIKPVREGNPQIKVYSSNDIFKQQTLVAIAPIEKLDPVSGKNEFIGASIAAMPMPHIEGLQNRLLAIIVFTQVVAWLIAFLLSSLLTRQIIKPVKRMRTAAKSIAAGNFKEKIPVTSYDEIGQLAESFNSMTKSLEDLEKMRSSFISDVSHELRTPMTTVSGFVEGMIDGTISEESREKYLKMVLEETRRMNRLVNDLLEASRLDQGTIKIEKAKIDLNRIVAETAFSYEKRLLEKKIDVELNLDGDECFAWADKDSIKRVMINLIDNAIKFTPECGKIIIKTGRDGKRASVSIQNSGEGIEREELRRIWERFYKTDKSRSLDRKGVGLGLYIVKSIIAQHGGEIFAESKVGEYTKFTFILEKSA